MKKLLTLLLISLTLTGVASAQEAAPAPARLWKNISERTQVMQTELGLTEDQVAKIHAAVEIERAAHRNIQKTIAERKDRLPAMQAASKETEKVITETLTTEQNLAYKELVKRQRAAEKAEAAAKKAAQAAGQ